MSVTYPVADNHQPRDNLGVRIEDRSSRELTVLRFTIIRLTSHVFAFVSMYYVDADCDLPYYITSIVRVFFLEELRQRQIHKHIQSHGKVISLSGYADVKNIKNQIFRLY